MREKEIRNLIIEIGRRLWTRQFVAANDGNISVRLGSGGFLTTPTGVSKGFLKPEMILRLGPDGAIRGPSAGFRPSSEIKMHLAVYEQRPDVGAVVHAHPPYATAFAVAGIPLDRHILPEAVLTLGSVPVAPYATPTTEEVPESIRPFLEHGDAVLLASHGALAVGVDLVSAYHRMETLEHEARILFYAALLGRVRTIPPEEIECLMEIRKAAGIPGRIAFDSCDSGNPLARLTKAFFEPLPGRS